MDTLEVVQLTWVHKKSCHKHDNFNLQYKRPPSTSHSKLTSSILQFLLTLKTQFEGLVQLQAQMEGSMFVYVYDDGEIASDPQTGVSFTYVKTIMIHIHRGFGLSKLIHVIIDKANRDGRDGVPLIHFKFPTKVCGQHVVHNHSNSR